MSDFYKRYYKTIKMVRNVLGGVFLIISAVYGTLTALDSRYASASQVSTNYKQIMRNASRNYAQDLEQRYKDLTSRQWALEDRYENKDIPKDVRRELELIQAEMQDIKNQLNDLLKGSKEEHTNFLGQMLPK